jgi:hypothetical protein
MLERTASNNGWKAQSHFDAGGLRVEIFLPVAQI